MQRTVDVGAIQVADRCRKDLGDLDSLAQSIRTVGLLHPPVVTPDLQLVAGERRLAAVKQLGWAELPVTISDGMDDTLALLAAERDENTCRKDLAPTEAVAIGRRIEAIEKPKAEARVGGRPPKTEGNLPTVSEKPEKARVSDVASAAVGMGRKTYEKAKQVVRAAEEDPETFAPLVEQMDKSGKVDKAYNALKKRKQEEEDEAKAAEVQDDAERFVVYTTPVADLAELVDAATVGAIVTDPPYPEEFLPAYSDLGEFAAHALEPGGSLLAMVGQAHLPEVIARLSEHLCYHWAMAYVMPGPTAKMWGRKVVVGWKPVLWFTKGDAWEPPNGMMPSDVAKSGQRDKEHHHWGQSEGGMAELIEKVTAPGAIICDPFVGGGATGLAAVTLNRYFIGADIDQSAVNRTKARLAEVV